MSRAWMPLYVGDYLRDTQHLDATESGAYLHLIMYYWECGELPSDDVHLQKIAKISPYLWKKIKPTIIKFFHDGWRHKRIDAELYKYEKMREKRRLSGLIGGTRRAVNAARWQAKATRAAQACAQANGQATTISKKEEGPAEKKGNGTLAVSSDLADIVSRKWGSQ